MAKKEEKEIERWVTVNGARVPIFKDGSIGGPKALRDKVQKKIDNDPANKTDEAMIEADNKKADKNRGKQPTEQEMRDFIKSKGHERFVDELSGHTESGYKQALQYVYDQDTLSKEEFRKKYFGDDTKAKQIDKDNDLKEKQIAKNQAEVDERNGKSIKLSKEEEQATYEYIKQNDWVHQQVNRELESGKDWDTVMAQVNNARKTAEAKKNNPLNITEIHYGNKISKWDDKKANLASLKKLVRNQLYPLKHKKQ